MNAPATSFFGDEADSVVAEALASASLEAANIVKARQDHAINQFTTHNTHNTGNTGNSTATRSGSGTGMGPASGSAGGSSSNQKNIDKIDDISEISPKNQFSHKMFTRANTIREIQLKSNISEMNGVVSKRKQEIVPKIIDIESRLSTPKPSSITLTRIKKDKINNINSIAKTSMKSLNYFPSIPNRLK